MTFGPAEIIGIVVGVVLLLLGRRLFWLFVAGIGFAVGFILADQFFNLQPVWLALVVAVIAGVVGAIFAILLQKIAVGVAGFLVGGYLAYHLIALFGWQIGQWQWVVIVLVGIAGAVFTVITFDWALIALSSLVGASLVVQPLGLHLPVQITLFCILLVVGCVVQGVAYSRRDS